MSISNSEQTGVRKALTRPPGQQGLYDPQFEHDACGVGFVANVKGRKSHLIIEQAIQVLLNLDHRGACGCEVNTGDGAGILMQMPHEFLKIVSKPAGIALPGFGEYSVGMVFLPPDAAERRECEKIFERIVVEEGQRFLGWRDIPTNNGPLGETAKASEPFMRQIFIGRSSKLSDDMAFERKLYVIRKQAENSIRYAQVPGGHFFYVASLSYKTLIYKGMLMPAQVDAYYPDLKDPAMETALALVHSRFSTNTFPSWERGHPYRYMAHNGEINTLRGNINWTRARQAMMESDLFGDDLKKLFPIINTDGSDSAMFDNCLELLVLAGRSLPHAMMMMIPEPWANHESMSDEKKAFYEFHSCLMEPWDGPASVAFTDGKKIGASLDRNGLRPSRYYVTKDDLVIMASEAGVLEVPAEKVLFKGRLQPGRMFFIDTEEGRIVADDEIKNKIANEHPYRQWLGQHLIQLTKLPDSPHLPEPSHETVLQRQQAFGYTFEDLRLLMAPMAREGVEAIGSMGTDTPLAVLSDKPQNLFNYFKQLFAQVTNPPIDCIREEIVTSAVTTIGSEKNLLKAQPDSAHLIELKSPILTNEELAKLRHIDTPGYKSATLPILYKVADGAKGLEVAMENLFAAADKAIADGLNILILSDRGIDHNNAAIPSLLAVSGLHHHLIRNGSRTRIGLVLESGEPREVHHFSLLIGYGCGAINPYLAFETLDDMIREGMLKNIDHKTACKNFVKAAVKGVVKVTSKMGISTIQSYRGAQIFEAVGLAKSVVDKYFTWTASRIEGADLDTMARETALRHRHAFPERQVNGHTLDVGGQYQWRAEGELHLFSPQTVHKLQHAVRTANYNIFKEYTRLVDDQLKKHYTLRGLLDFKPATPVPIEEVESVETILKRFKSGAMSYGSISQEAHEALAIAMNRIGGKSNTGEGGEDPERYFSNKGPSPFVRGKRYTRKEIAQILGGGSEIEFLPEIDGRIVAGCLRPDLNPNAPEMILPGFGPNIERTARLLCEQRNIIPIFIRRVANEWEYVGDYEVRDFSTSRPVIEEQEIVSGRSGESGISRVIYLQPRNYDDSKNSAIKQVASGRFGVTSLYLVNAKELQIKMAQGAKPGEGGQLPGAKVYPWIARVRHSTPGVGLISPPPHHDIYSIEDLAELIHDLKNSNHHARISVKLVAEVGVGTIAAGVAKAHADVVLISGYDGGTGASPQTSIKHAGIPWELGLAETHQTLVLNNLRSRIAVETDGQLKSGRDVVIAAMLGAEEFGFATAPLVALGCIMMRVCHLNTCPVGVATQDPNLRKNFTGDPAHAVNFMRFIAQEVREWMAQLGFRTVNEMIGRTDRLEARKAVEHWKARGLDFSKILYQPDAGPEVGRFCQITQDHGLDKSLDNTVLMNLCKPALLKKEKVSATIPIRNVNRVVGTIVGSEVTRRHGVEGLPEDTIKIHFKGSAGQSFGAFMPKGMTFTLEGDANDYLGKGLSGGRIILYPPDGSSFVAEENMIAGNVALYGATGGEVFIRGMAGERFAVRNSGVSTVVEAIGDHGCEYMTGGTVVVLGPTGRNFAAGMSGGIAYILDEKGDFGTRCNMQMVALEKFEDNEESESVRQLIQRHAEYTKSERAWKVLALWEKYSGMFVKVMPKDYKRVLSAIKKAKQQGLSGEDAINAAFEENAKDLARVGGG